MVTDNQIQTTIGLQLPYNNNACACVRVCACPCCSSSASNNLGRHVSETGGIFFAMSLSCSTSSPRGAINKCVSTASKYMRRLDIGTENERESANVRILVHDHRADPQGVQSLMPTRPLLQQPARHQHRDHTGASGGTPGRDHERRSGGRSGSVCGT